MTVEYRTGDLFEQKDLDALAHGVNCKGVMGSGIAPLFKKKYPGMYSAYRMYCLTGQLTLGKVMPWHDKSIWVFNIASQHKPGKNADLVAIESGLQKTLHYMERKGISSLGIPRIGCGIGGLQWKDVEQVCEKVFKDSNKKLVIVTLP